MKKGVVSLVLVLLMLMSTPFSAAFAPSNEPTNLSINAQVVDGRMLVGITIDPPDDAHFGGAIERQRLQVETAFGDGALAVHPEMLEIVDGNAQLLIDLPDGDPQGMVLNLRARFVVTTLDDGVEVEVYSEWASALTVVGTALPDDDATDGWTPGEDAVAPGDTQYVASGWAEAEVARAVEAGLMPLRLGSANLSANISRLEFAEICLLLYSRMTDESTDIPYSLVFSDCSEAAALKAYALGITNGISGSVADETLIFGPHRAISRQQAAVMLARTYKKATMAGWSPSVDGRYDFNYAMPAPFYDDKYIQAYAYQSVYFLSAKNIIKGVELGGKLNFDPYGLISREQSLLLASRMLDSLVR